MAGPSATQGELVSNWILVPCQQHRVTHMAGPSATHGGLVSWLVIGF